MSSSLDGVSTLLATSDEIACIPCDCGQNLEVTAFCGNHNEVACQTCKTMKHRNCNTLPLSEKGSTYRKENLESVEVRANRIMAETFQILEKREADLKTLASMKEICKNDIRSFRTYLNKVLDMLEENIIEDMETFDSRERLEIERHILSCSTTKQLIEKDFKLLDEVKTLSDKTSMFAADVKIANHLKTYERLLTDITREARSPVLNFKPDTKLSHIRNDIKEFGSFAVDYVRPSLAKGTILPDIEVKTSIQVDIKSPKDKTTSSISGCAFMPGGEIIVCDWANGVVKLLNTSFRLEDRLDLSCSPYDVSVIDKKKAVVTLPDKKQLQFLEVLPKLNTVGAVQLDVPCWGVEIIGDEIFASCHGRYWLSRVADVRVFDFNGILKRKLGINQDGSNMFEYPYYITVNGYAGKIYISDSSTAQVTCLMLDGNVVYQYSDKHLKATRAVYVDDKDNVLVCGEESNNLYIIDENGKKKSILLTSIDGIQSPRSVAYRHTDDTIVVGCRDTNTFYAFRTK